MMTCETADGKKHSFNQLTSDEVYFILKGTGALIKDTHVVYASGRHGSSYINKDAVYPYPERIVKICSIMANVITRYILDEFISMPNTIAGPEKGGIILSQYTALSMVSEGLTSWVDVKSVFAEKDGDGFIFKRGYDKYIKAPNKVLLVEDILTTGGSLKKVVNAINDLGGEVVAAIVMYNRGDVKPADVGVNTLISLINEEHESWEPNKCPLCKEGVPINTTIGHGGK